MQPRADHVTLAVSPDRDPERLRLRGALEAHFAAERATAIVALLLRLLAATGVPVWIAAAWPAALSSDARVLALGASAVCQACLACAWLSERRRRRASVVRTLELGRRAPIARDPASGEPAVDG